MSAPSLACGGVVALGNFDGVHLGHRALIQAASAVGERYKRRIVAAVFEPHPRRYFDPNAPPFRLQSSAQRARALRASGAEDIIVITFDAALAALSGRAFAEQVLVNQIGAAHVCVGGDFRFGEKRMSDAAELARLGGEIGFGVTAIAPLETAGVKFSSSAIRAAIAAGDVSLAGGMLARPWAIEGEVAPGFARGRGFGFPTANLALGDYVRPRLGIYAVRALVEGQVHDGVASVGINPTLGGLPAPILEVHIFDFDRDIYGETIEVSLIAYLRDETKFDDVEALKTQMALDCRQAREKLAAANA
ncbi:MAG: bifunctional riboflavin kinase/FAD synthetase [Terricaulis sp.]